MNSVKITAITEKGMNGLDEMKKQLSSRIARWSFKKLKTTISLEQNSVTISNPSMQFIDDVKNNEKGKSGIEQIKDGFSEFGAEEGTDYKIEII